MNYVEFAKIAKCLGLVLLLAGSGLTGCKSDMNRADSVDSSKRSAEPPQEQPEVKDEQTTALAASRKAVEPAPDDMSGWNELGHQLHRTGEFDQAEEAYRKVLALAEAHQDKDWQAAAYSNLGNVYQTCGDLDRAEELYGKALELHQALGNKQGTADDYGNLGNVYYKRGEMDRAEELWLKSLAISEALGLKEATANQYGKLGSMYQQRGNLDQAEEMWKKSLVLYHAMGHPNTKMIQEGLDELAQQRASQPAPPTYNPR